MSTKKTDMTNSAKKMLERYFLDVFKKLLPDFPEGEIMESEKPDFLINTAKDRVGIELARIFQEQSESGSSLREEEENIRNIINKACIIYERQRLHPLYVNITFNRIRSKQKDHLNQLAHEIAKFVMTHIPPVNDPCFIRNSEQFRSILSDEIDSVAIGRFNSLSKNSWGTTEAGFIPENIVTHLQQLINRKNKNIESYHLKCDKCWLLVVAESARISSSFTPSETVKTNEYYSLFERTFYVDVALDNYFELKAAKQKLT
jgi:hypothetical protein